MKLCSKDLVLVLEGFQPPSLEITFPAAIITPQPKLLWCHMMEAFLRKRNLTVKFPLGARLRGRTATQRSKKGSEKVLGRVLEEGF